MTEPAAAALAKRELRSQLRAQRLDLAAPARMQAAEAIVGFLDHAQTALPTGYIAGYWAMAGELPLHVLQMSLGPDRVWCLPCIQPDNSLRFAPWRAGDELVSNRYGIPEPALSGDAQLPAADMAAILVPLLGFTRDGMRLGMGGGYYDRSLAFRQGLPAPPLLIGVGYSFQELPHLQGEPWDVKLDAVVTEREFIRCRHFT